MTKKQTRKRKPGRSYFMPIPVFNEEAEYVHRKAYSMNLSASKYVRMCVIPSNWPEELKKLRETQGDLPKRQGRPRILRDKI